MAQAIIPVDMTNPGQVFACLGFLEAADALLGDAAGGFDLSTGTVGQFELSAQGSRNPFEAVLEFLALASLEPVMPTGVDIDGETVDADGDDTADDEGDGIELVVEPSQTYPSGDPDRMTFPIRLGGGNRPSVVLDHWADGSSRTSFKLYAGNRTALSIAIAMQQGAQASAGKTKGVAQLWEDNQARLVSDPFGYITPMGGSFNFDPRGAWTAIDAGYSPNEHKHMIAASPVVEFMAAWGLSHARPDEYQTRKVRYAVWGVPLPPMLARVALSAGLPAIPQFVFQFDLEMSGKNKVVTFARLENRA